MLTDSRWGHHLNVTLKPIPHAKGRGVLAGLDDERPVRRRQDAGIGEYRMPAGEVVPEIHRRGTSDVDRNLEPGPHLVRVRQVAQVALGEIRERRDGPL